MSDVGSVPGRPQSHIHPGKLDNGQNPEPSVIKPQRQLDAASDLPQEVNGMKVVPFTVEPTATWFTSSQITALQNAGRYKEFEKDILFAYNHGLVKNDDAGAAKLAETQEKAWSESESSKRMIAAVEKREATKALDVASKELSNAKSEFETAKNYSTADPYRATAAEKRLSDANAKFTEANDRFKATQSTNVEAQ